MIISGVLGIIIPWVIGGWAISSTRKFTHRVKDPNIRKIMEENDQSTINVIIMACSINTLIMIISLALSLT